MNTQPEMSQDEIERYNDRQLWADVENHLRIAVECIEQAQATLDADLHMPGHADLLNEQRNDLMRARQEAAENSEAA